MEEPYEVRRAKKCLKNLLNVFEAIESAKLSESSIDDEFRIIENRVDRLLIDGCATGGLHSTIDCLKKFGKWAPSQVVRKELEEGLMRAARGVLEKTLSCLESAFPE